MQGDAVTMKRKPKAQLSDLLGAYAVRATSEIGVNTRALFTKIEASAEFDEAERVTLLRALEWCVRYDAQAAKARSNR